MIAATVVDTDRLHDDGLDRPDDFDDRYDRNIDQLALAIAAVINDQELDLLGVCEAKTAPSSTDS